jgi:pimeloyl-ACP methyl ester carboxylesterase
MASTHRSAGGVRALRPWPTRRFSAASAGSLFPLWCCGARADRIVEPAYGRAYAAAIPGARFEVLPVTGHVPQMETPDLVVQTIWDSDVVPHDGSSTA